jgi:peptidoglycan/LPS O-acetylase OafA/YrhL
VPDHHGQPIVGTEVHNIAWHPKHHRLQSKSCAGTSDTVLGRRLAISADVERVRGLIFMLKTNQDVHSLPFMPQLDSLRALSVLAVIYTHYFPEKYWLLGVGELGVRCFFVLSGFLITSILLRDLHAGPSFRAVWLAFISRRAFRLYPVLLVTLTVAAALNIGATRETVLWNVAYLTNFYVVKIGHWPVSGGALWSLAVEEQFYLFWPLVIFLVPRRFLPIVFVGFIASALVFRIVWRAMGLGDFGAWVLPPGSFDALAMGAMLALSVKQTRMINIVGFVGLCLFVAGKLSNWWTGAQQWTDAEIDATGAAMMFTWVIGRASLGFEGPIGKVLNNSVLQYLGTISYGIYILHGFVREYVTEHLSWMWHPRLVAITLVAITMTITLASLSWHLMERPIIQAGRRRLPRIGSAGH